MRAPSNNPVTLFFGATSDPYTASNPHKGVDFGWRSGNGSSNLNLVMPCDATLTLKPNNGADGNGLYFTSPDGRYFMGLLHTAEYLVDNGVFVQEGEVVAIMGATGAAQGVHCHWAVIDKQRPKDPVLGQYIDGLTLVSGGSGGEEEAMYPDENHVRSLFRAYRLREATDQEVADNAGKTPFNILEEELDSGDERTEAVRITNLGKQADKENWAGQVSGKVKVLKPGLYSVE